MSFPLNIGGFLRPKGEIINPSWFITEWTVPSGSFTFPAGNIGTYNAEIDFGDGGGWKTVTAYNDPDLTNNYASGGTYEIRIRGTFPWVYINNGSVKTYIDQVTQWGSVDFQSFNNAFYGATNLTSVPAADPSNNFMTGVIRTSGMFRNCNNVSFNPVVDDYDMSAVTNAQAMFLGATYFNNQISSWDLSSAPRLDLLVGLTSFDQDIGSLDVSLITIMDNMMLGVTMSTSNYDGTLIGWEAQSLQNNVNFSAGGSKYSAGAAATAKANIISTYSWNITDGGQE